MPSRIGLWQEQNIQQRLAEAKTLLEESDLILARDSDGIVTNIKQNLEKAVETREHLETIATKEESEASISQIYVSRLSRTSSRLADLELVLSYHDLYSGQRDRMTDRMEKADEVLSELKRALGISVQTIPVLWRSYSLIPVFGDVTVVRLPRYSELIPTSPVLAHELAHVVHGDEDFTKPRSFVTRFRELRDQIDDEAIRDDFHYNWDEWFEELFCDACGFYLYGPAYVISHCYHLFGDQPYSIDRDVEPEDNLHPPDALRFQLLEMLTEENLPKDLRDRSADVRGAYEDHLAAHASDKPGFYDRWVDEGLLRETAEAAAAEVGDELESILARIADPSVSESDDQYSARITANEYWLSRGGE